MDILLLAALNVAIGVLSVVGGKIIDKFETSAIQDSLKRNKCLFLTIYIIVSVCLSFIYLMVNQNSENQNKKQHFEIRENNNSSVGAHEKNLSSSSLKNTGIRHHESTCGDQFNLRIDTVFYLFLYIFALIGSIRGWDKELLVMFSIIIALCISQVVQTYVPIVSRMLYPSEQFLLWSLLLVTFALFGYHFPGVHKSEPPAQSQKPPARSQRPRLQDWLLGAILGACNGYLSAGTVLSYLHMAGYPFPGYISAPKPGTPAGDAALKLITWLPPAWLGVPEIYFAVAIAFAIIVIVFI